MGRTTPRILGTIFLLQLVAAGVVEGGENQREGVDLANPGSTLAPQPQRFTDSAQRRDTLPLPGSLGGAKASAGEAVGLRTQPPQMRRRAKRPSLLIALYVSQATLQGLDAQSTLRALHTGMAREGNPILSPFAANSTALVIFKLALAAGTIYGIDRLYKHHPRLALGTLGVVNAEYAAAVLWNYRRFPGH